MPVKRKLNKKRTKMPRNVKINSKSSKRASQKKRGRRASKRGGAGNAGNPGNTFGAGVDALGDMDYQIKGAKVKTKSPLEAIQIYLDQTLDIDVSSVALVDFNALQRPDYGQIVRIEEFLFTDDFNKSNRRLPAVVDFKCKKLGIECLRIPKRTKDKTILPILEDLYNGEINCSDD
jgi:hypothetical protein